MFTRAIIKPLIAVLLFALPAFGQGTNIPPKTVLNTINGITRPVASATITVCAALVGGIPCSPALAGVLFKDAALTQPLSNPFTADANGNYTFTIAPGVYTVTETAAGFSGYSYQLGVSAVSGTAIGTYTIATLPPNPPVNTIAAVTDGNGLNCNVGGGGNRQLCQWNGTSWVLVSGSTASGAQLNVINSWTAQQNFDANLANKGPNPWADVARFGAYFGPANPGTSTTGTITSGTPNLVLANAQDFANQQGMLVLGAGSASALGTPTGVQVAPWGVTGATTYTYCVAAEDYFGGRTPCSAAGASTTSAATLGITPATLSSCNRAAGISTCTTTGNHNFTAGAQVNIVKNSTGDATHGFEGVFSILTTPTASTFTYAQYGALDVSGTVTTGTAQVNATNLVKWQSDASNTVLRWYIYRCPPGSCTLPGNAGNYAFAGIAVGVDGYFQDYGLGTNVAIYGNGDVPATAPTTASNTALSTTILSGGGTTSLTLANNASTTVAGAKVLHDNTPNLVAACNSLLRGGITYIPNSNVFANWFPINSPFKLSSCPASTQLQVGNKIWANAPIVMVGFQNIQGLPSSSYGLPAFYYIRPAATIGGFGFPLIYMSPLVGNNLSLDDLVLLCDQAYQPCIFQDQNTTGGSLTGARYRNVHTNGGSGLNTTWVVKGGFGHFWEYGGWSNSASSFASPPAMLFSPNCGLGNAGQQIAGLVSTQYTYGFGGTVFDACNQGTPQGMSYISFRDMIAESSRGPMFRFANTGASTPSGNIAFWEIVRPDYADPLAGGATPLIDAMMAQQITGLHIVSPSTSGSPLIESNSGGVTGVDVSADYTGIVGAQNYTISGAGIFSNVPARASGTLGHFAYQMALPSPPQSAIVSAGGAVPVGAHTYTVAAVDFSGNETTISTGVTATTTGGNQTVTVTLPATFPAGAKGVNVYRDGARANNGACGTSPQFTTPGGTYVDTFASNCGQSQSSTNNAGVSIMDANGVATMQLRLNTELLTASPRAEQSVFLPGALTSTWTGSSWTLDKAITVTRVQVQVKTAPVTCTPNAIVRLTDGSSPVNVTVSAAANDSGAVSQNYAAGAVLTVTVQTAAAGCGTSPADASVVVQYKMQ